jgi:hypothetical protein
MGHLIPAGTGLKKYDRIEVEVEEDEAMESSFDEGAEPAEEDQEPLSAIQKVAGEE